MRLRTTAATRLSYLLALIIVSACMIESSEPIETVPAYPGSSIGPGYRRTEDSLLLLKQSYYSPDSYIEVARFYDSYVTADPTGWEGRIGNGGMSIWRKNMRLDGTMSTGIALDPTQPGEAIVVLHTLDRTVIRTFGSYPQ